jgi:hypothetical protein
MVKAVRLTIPREIIEYAENLFKTFTPTHMCYAKVLDSIMLLKGVYCAADFYNLFNNPTQILGNMLGRKNISKNEINAFKLALTDHSRLFAPIAEKIQQNVPANTFTMAIDCLDSWRKNGNKTPPTKVQIPPEISKTVDDIMTVLKAWAGIGFWIDAELGTDKRVFTVIGPHSGRTTNMNASATYYGNKEVLIIFNNESMHKKDFWITPVAAITYHQGGFGGGRFGIDDSTPWSEINAESEETEESEKTLYMAGEVINYSWIDNGNLSYGATPLAYNFIGKLYNIDNTCIKDVKTFKAAVNSYYSQDRNSHYDPEGHLPCSNGLDLIEKIFVTNQFPKEKIDKYNQIFSERYGLFGIVEAVSDVALASWYYFKGKLNEPQQALTQTTLPAQQMSTQQAYAQQMSTQQAYAQQMSTQQASSSKLLAQQDNPKYFRIEHVVQARTDFENMVLTDISMAKHIANTPLELKKFKRLEDLLTESAASKNRKYNFKGSIEVAAGLNIKTRSNFKFLDLVTLNRLWTQPLSYKTISNPRFINADIGEYLANNDVANSVVTIAANSNHMGGGFSWSQGSQEEVIFRATNITALLPKGGSFSTPDEEGQEIVHTFGNYPKGGLFAIGFYCVNGVQAYRNGQFNNQTFAAAFVAAPDFRGKYFNITESELSKTDYIKGMLVAMRSVYEFARLLGYKKVINTFLGASAFQNNKRLVYMLTFMVAKEYRDITTTFITYGKEETTQISGFASRLLELTPNDLHQAILNIRSYKN